MGNNDLLGTGFYFGLMNIFLLVWFGLLFFLSGCFHMIGLRLNLVMKVS